MYLRIIANIFLVFLLAIFQVSFISALPAWFSNINLIIILLVFVLSIKGFSHAFWWLIGAGMILEIYSFLPFGVFLFSLMFTVLLVNFLLVNFFTNRSLYSYLALSISAIFVYEFILYLLNYFLYYFSDNDFILNINKSFFLEKFGVLVVNGLAVMVLFYIYNFISKNFQPVFLVRGKIKK